MQRNDFQCDRTTGRPQLNQYSSRKYEITSCSIDKSKDLLKIRWQDGLESHYSNVWIDEQVDRLIHFKEKKGKVKRKPWFGLTEQHVRDSDMTLPFDHVLHDDQSHAIRALHTHGILLVTGTPINDPDGGSAAIAALAASLSGGAVKSRGSSLLPQYQPSQGGDIVLRDGTDGPLRTLYGTVWSTRAASQTDGASTADSAYSNDALPLHTDMTYHANPPGLQIFTMVQPAISGGESVFGDGLYCAERLRHEYPQAFATLTKVPRVFRCIDYTTGWHLEATGPMIQLGLDGTSIVAIRHNDLDRLPDVPVGACCEDGMYERLNEAHAAWDAILADDDTRLVLRLQPGDTVVVANQRCFHGRHSFETTESAPRTVMGCYVSQDELDSRFRMLGLEVAS